MRHRLLEFTFLKVRLGKIFMRRPVPRPQCYSLFEARNRFIHAPAAKQDDTQVGLSDVVLWSHGQRMRPKPLTILPVGGLDPGAPCEDGDNKGAQASCDHLAGSR